MMQTRCWFQPKKAALCCLLALVLLGSRRGGATTYVPMSDRDLADRVPAIALVSVESSGAAPAGGGIATDSVALVERVIKGSLPGSRIVIRIPGGIRADGVGLKIWGAPALRDGEQALVFLLPDADGSFTVAGLMLGVFHLRDLEQKKVALRDLSEAHPVALPGRAAVAPDTEPVRDAERFIAWLADRAAGIERPADYRLAETASRRQAIEKFTQLSALDGKYTRWFQFDSGKSARWLSYSAGQPGLSPDATAASFAAAVNAWSNDPTSTILYSYGGTTQVTGGLRGNDGVNAILFNDPNGEVPGTFDCVAGGVLSMGGPFYYLSTLSFHGTLYHETFEGDVVTNDNSQCFFQDNPTGAEEVFAHELGHTLGFGHSSDRQALMYSKAHNDGRGAQLGIDDRVGASQVYGDGSYQPPPPPPPPDPYIRLNANPTSKTTVQLGWTHNLKNQTSFDVEQQQRDGTFKVVASLNQRGKALVVKALTANTVYVFRVRGHVAGKPDVESNTAKARTRR